MVQLYTCRFMEETSTVRFDWHLNGDHTRQIACWWHLNVAISKFSEWQKLTHWPKDLTIRSSWQKPIFSLTSATLAVHLCQTTIWCPVLWTVCCRWLCWPIDQRIWLCPSTLVWPASVTKRIAVNTILSLSQNSFSLSDGEGCVPDPVLWSPSDNCKIGDKPSSKQLASL